MSHGLAMWISGYVTAMIPFGFNWYVNYRGRREAEVALAIHLDGKVVADAIGRHRA